MCSFTALRTTPHYNKQKCRQVQNNRSKLSWSLCCRRQCERNGILQNSVAACVRQETGQRKHRTSLSEQPVCRDSPPRLELSLLCVCSFTSVNALLHLIIACFYQHNHCYFQALGGVRSRSPHNAKHSTSYYTYG